MQQVTYIIQSSYKGCEDWDDTNYDDLESLKAARNTMEGLRKALVAENRTRDWRYRIVKQVREVVK